MHDGQWLPTRKQLVHIAKILKRQIQQLLCQNCQQADYVNLTYDGWTDPGGRRYQAVTVRFIKGIFAAPVGLLAMKEVKSVHERAVELRAMIQHLQMQFRIADKTLNLCSDRCSMNVQAFRKQKGELNTVFGESWLPCACRILNNLLSLCMSPITETARPIFRIQRRFRKCGPFVAFLQSRAAPIQATPSIRTVLILSPYMEEFTQEEQLAMPELNGRVQTVANVPDSRAELALRAVRDCFNCGLRSPVGLRCCDGICDIRAGFCRVSEAVARAAAVTALDCFLGKCARLCLGLGIGDGCEWVDRRSREGLLRRRTPGLAAACTGTSPAARSVSRGDCKAVRLYTRRNTRASQLTPTTSAA
jgi:hypothetical protein